MKEFSRRMVSENKLCVDDLIWPLFVCEGNNVADKINSMPGVFRFSIDNILKELETARKENRSEQDPVNFAPKETEAKMSDNQNTKSVVGS